MSRDILFLYQGKQSAWASSKITREDLYGKRKRLPLDASGQPCSRASLTSDGSMLVRAGMTAQGYYDADGKPVSNSELQPIAEDGTVLEKLPSTLGVPQELKEMSETDLLDLRIDSVLLLEAKEVDDELLRALKSGTLFQSVYRARPDANPNSMAALVANKDGDVFLLTGDKTEPAWCDAAVRIPTFEEEGTDDDLDFEMF